MSSLCLVYSILLSTLFYLYSILFYLHATPFYSILLYSIVYSDSSSLSTSRRVISPVIDSPSCPDSLIVDHQDIHRCQPSFGGHRALTIEHHPSANRRPNTEPQPIVAVTRPPPPLPPMPQPNTSGQEHHPAALLQDGCFRCLLIIFYSVYLFFILYIYYSLFYIFIVSIYLFILHYLFYSSSIYLFFILYIIGYHHLLTHQILLHPCVTPTRLFCT
jgi:hypothetical protein